RYMGGLRRVMPWTYVTFLIGALSLAGVFPLAGFWSKDEVLLSAWLGRGAAAPLVFWMAMGAVFLTAFYMFRVMLLTFHGQFRGGADAEHAQLATPASEEHVTVPAVEDTNAHGGVHPAESPMVMMGPMIVLAILALGAGYVANPLSDLASVPAHWFVEFLGEHAEGFDLTLALASTGVALAGITLATLIYGRRTPSPEAVGRTFGPLRTLLFNKYYLDTLYEGVIVRNLFYQGIARGLNWFDQKIIDGFADLLGWLSRNSGRAVLPLQNGQAQVYGIVISVGILIIAGVYLVLGR
ncbi:MAG: hypothetical protein HY532_05165, partial [Chloroflexi bacterium]|nr:hypothetical protein [Chloroflexota bacterium]